MSEGGRIVRYADFWPFYLRQHAHAATRHWHIAGTVGAVILLSAGIFALNEGLILGAVLTGYGPAWIAHAFIERNRPATFRYPLWSLISDFRMAGVWLSGRLDVELRKAGIET